MPSKTYFYKLWVNLSGDPSEFPLNARIFHSICLISIFALSYNIPFNYLIGLPHIAWASLVVLVLASLLYYFSRYRNQGTRSVHITNVVGLALFFVNYFLNSGLEGPTDLFFLLFLLVSIGISPVDEYKFWIPVNIGLFLLLCIFEYFSPENFPNTYNTRFSRFIDHMSAYVVVAAITYFCIDYIRVGYERERNSAAEKSRAIEEQNEQIIKQNQELESLNAEKNKLMSIVAHDLRSPLGSIQNFLELLTQHELDPDQRLEIENDLLNTTKNTTAMLSKLLEWSKSQLHGVTPHPERLNLAKLLEPTLQLEKNVAARKNVTLDYELEPSLVIYADADMMQLIVRNIVGNAIKFTRSGGKIEVRAQLADHLCIISVKDNGIGISPEKQEAIFSLNVQSTYGTRNEKGVGLGLLLCLEFIQAQNGSIWFESSSDEGTCFFISIPITDEGAVPNSIS